MSGSYTIIDKNSLDTLKNDISLYPGGVVIPIDKPYGWTSADVVRKIKFSIQKFFNKKNIKVGHAGTLDPLATGILLICIDKATKQAEKLQAERKEYVADICFGATTPSFDLEKEIDFTYPFEHIKIDSIQAVLPSFIGEIEQVPPIFSAKLINGTRAYEYARAGEEVEMRSSLITIYNLEILTFDSPKLTIRIECSKGTYIRSFARDIGLALESGAHLTDLRRTSSGIFHIDQSVKMEELQKKLHE